MNRYRDETAARVLTGEKNGNDVIFYTSAVPALSLPRK